MRPVRKTIAIHRPIGEELEEFRRELESILRRRIWMTEVVAYAIRYARGNAEKIVQRETVPSPIVLNGVYSCTDGEMNGEQSLD